MSLSITGNAWVYARASKQMRTKRRCVDVKVEPDGSKRRIADRTGPMATEGLEKLKSRVKNHFWRVLTFADACAVLTIVSTSFLNSEPPYLICIGSNCSIKSVIFAHNDPSKGIFFPVACLPADLLILAIRAYK